MSAAITKNPLYGQERANPGNLDAWIINVQNRVDRLEEFNRQLVISNNEKNERITNLEREIVTLKNNVPATTANASTGNFA